MCLQKSKKTAHNYQWWLCSPVLDAIRHKNRIDSALVGVFHLGGEEVSKILIRRDFISRNSSALSSDLRLSGGLSGSAWFAGCLRPLLVLFNINSAASLSSRFQSSQTRSKRNPFLWPTILQQGNIDNNEPLIFYVTWSWKDRWKLMYGTSEVTRDWRRLLLKTAWETAKQALPLHSAQSSFVSVVIDSDSPTWAAITASTLLTALKKPSDILLIK